MEISEIAAIDEQSKAVVADKMSRTYRIHVSNTKKPFIFYLNLAKKYIHRYNNIELTALGMAIPTVVVISEILKANGIATQKLISISTIKTKDESTGKSLKKAKIQIVMGKINIPDKPKANETVKGKDVKIVDSMTDVKKEDKAMIATELEKSEVAEEMTDMS